jgi:dTMP kinase
MADPTAAEQRQAAPLLIAVEGVDGSGKSGVARAIADGLRGRGIEPVTTREPGGTPEGESLRALILAGQDDTWDPASELLLMTAARVQHVRHVIQPALAMGKVIVSDRFVGSTIAYQGAGRGLSIPFIRELHLQTVGNVWPDVTVLLDVDAAVGLARSRRRLADGNIDEGRFEGLHLAFHQRIRQCFLDQAALDPDRHLIIDAAGPPETVRDEAVRAILARLDGQQTNHWPRSADRRTGPA